MRKVAANKVREKGWILSAYSMPPDAQEINSLRIVVRPHMNRDVSEILANDIEEACQYLEQHGARRRRQSSMTCTKRQRNVNRLLGQGRIWAHSGPQVSVSVKKSANMGDSQWLWNSDPQREQLELEIASRFSEANSFEEQAAFEEPIRGSKATKNRSSRT